MRIRGLLIAVVVLAALAGGVYWSNKVKKAEEGKPAADAPPKSKAKTARTRPFQPRYATEFRALSPCSSPSSSASGRISPDSIMKDRLPR